MELTLNTIDLEKIYRLGTDILTKLTKNTDWDYIFICPNGIKATDSYRLGFYKGVYGSEEVPIPKNVVKMLKTIKAKIVKFKKNDNKLELECLSGDNKTLIISTDIPTSTKAKFEFIENQLENYYKCLTVNSGELKRILKAALEKSTICAFSFNEKLTKVIIYDKNKRECGEEILKTAVSTHSTKILLDPRFLFDYVKKMEDDVPVKIYYENSSCFIYGRECENAYGYVLMPIALRGE